MIHQLIRLITCCLTLFLVSCTALPFTLSTQGDGNADVTFVRAQQQGTTWTFHVTVSHPDTGWDDYADGWDVILLDGAVLKPDVSSPFTRLLLHPHENEQPFTRSQSNITIPHGTQFVIVRAHDLVDGWGGKSILVDLEATSGIGYTIESSQ